MTVAGPVTAFSAIDLVGAYASDVKYSVALPMTMPVTSPITTAPQTFVAFGRPIIFKTKNEPTLIMIELILVPRDIDPSSSELVAPSLVFTKNIPIIDAKTPTTPTKTGANTAVN